MTASSALSGSTSITMTSAPWPLPRIARPRPHQPYPATRRSAGDEEVGGADDAVHGALAGAVTVVEEVLRVCFVDGDDREHEAPSASMAFRRMTPVVVSSVPPMTSAAMSRRSLWSTPTTSAPSSMVMLGRGRRTVDVRVVGCVVLAADGVDADTVVVDERGGDVVLRAQRVARAEHQVGTSGAQRAHQVRGLGGDVEAGAYAHALERLLLLETLANDLEHGHLLAAHSMRRTPSGARPMSLMS